MLTYKISILLSWYDSICRYQSDGAYRIVLFD